ncbi:MAG: hypothetical protein ACTSYA_05270, partial [Candidatus Kariarchaeaceae archaeon]
MKRQAFFLIIILIIPFFISSMELHASNVHSTKVIPSLTYISHDRINIANDTAFETVTTSGDG